MIFFLLQAKEITSPVVPVVKDTSVCIARVRTLNVDLVDDVITDILFVFDNCHDGPYVVRWKRTVDVKSRSICIAGAECRARDTAYSEQHGCNAC